MLCATLIGVLVDIVVIVMIVLENFPFPVSEHNQEPENILNGFSSDTH